ncbi:MAG: hypothetical protein LBK69_06970 [Syntrophomonadaceae bacterium]|jgi:uncharacterized protein YbjT (DUF2867 family)|nr:hypothetical protein [Syntrophomonadaceae bacterium]
MKILIFGVTGMVGQGVLRECLLDAEVTEVQTIGRNKSGIMHPKLKEIRHSNMMDYSGLEEHLSGFDACFFCLGVSSAGMGEAKYTRVTYDITKAAAETLARLNAEMVFVYVSGSGTDSTEQGRIMWRRVKGKTENMLLKLTFKAAYMFRPGIIQPLRGIRSKTKMYSLFYMLFKPAVYLMHKLFPNAVITTQELGQAMLNIIKFGSDKNILEAADIKFYSERKNFL